MAERTVHVVEDDSLIRDLVATMLRRAQFTPLEHGSLGDLKSHFDGTAAAVVMDLNLGAEDGIDGIQFLKQARYDGPVIFISGVDTRTLAKVEGIARSQGLTVAGSLSKPFKPQHLVELVSEAAKPAPRMDLAEAIEQGRIEPFYQPIMDLQTGALAGAEALARWRQPDGQIMSPALFIGQAEENGLIDPLTESIMAQAVADCARWRREIDPTLQVAVNVSAVTLEKGTLLDMLQRCCAEAGLLHEALKVEITESVAMHDVNAAIEQLTRIGIKGFRLALDDFGTGFSSLTALLRMPFSQLKVDQSFIRGMMHDREARCVVEAVLGMAGGLGLQTVAEGIEDSETAVALRSMGYHYGQGYFVAKPMPRDAFLKFARAARVAQAS